MLARREREQTDQQRLMEAVTKHIVGNTVESAMGTKKGAGQKAAESVRFTADPKRARAGKRAPTVAQVTGMFGGRPKYDVPAGMTLSEVIAGA